MKENQAWKRSETILHYQRTADITIPKRREMLATIAELATSQFPRRLRVLDLGCGTGDIAGEILGLRPEATICMLDFFEGMLELAGERFRDAKNVRILRHDLNDGIPKELLPEKFDVVTSCFALHHLEFERRVGLYADVFRVLDEDGLFINGDIVLRESPAVREWELNRLITWIVGQAKSKLGIERTFEQVKETHTRRAIDQGDKPGTMQDMFRDLKEAGFPFADCVWMENRHEIITASKG